MFGVMVRDTLSYVTYSTFLTTIILMSHISYKNLVSPGEGKPFTGLIIMWAVIASYKLLLAVMQI